MMELRRGSLLLAVLLSGCGGGLLRLPDSALTELPVEGRRWIFDAENAVVAALDNLDLARDAEREAGRMVARAARSLEAARKQEKQRGTDLGVKAAQRRLAMTQLQLELCRKLVQLARRKAAKARADLELDKARLVVAYDLVAMRGFSLAPFEAQAQDAQRQVEAQQKQADALLGRVKQEEERWQSARQTYIAKTGDHDSGVWLE